MLTLLLSLSLYFIFDSSKVDIHILVEVTNTSIGTVLSILLKVVRSCEIVVATKESLTFKSEVLLDKEFDFLDGDFALRVINTNLGSSDLIRAEDVLVELASQLGLTLLAAATDGDSMGLLVYVTLLVFDSLLSDHEGILVLHLIVVRYTVDLDGSIVLDLTLRLLSNMSIFEVER